MNLLRNIDIRTVYSCTSERTREKTRGENLSIATEVSDLVDLPVPEGSAHPEGSLVFEDLMKWTYQSFLYFHTNFRSAPSGPLKDNVSFLPGNRINRDGQSLEMASMATM